MLCSISAPQYGHRCRLLELLQLPSQQFGHSTWCVHGRNTTETSFMKQIMQVQCCGRSRDGTLMPLYKNVSPSNDTSENCWNIWRRDSSPSTEFRQLCFQIGLVWLCLSGFLSKNIRRASICCFSLITCFPLSCSFKKNTKKNSNFISSSTQTLKAVIR